MAFLQRVIKFLEVANQIEAANEPLLLRKMVQQSVEVYGPPKMSVAVIKDLVISVNNTEIPIRLYYPSAGKRAPLIVFFHGGGHMTGDIDVYDTQVRMIAHHTGMTVASVDYRLSPEFPYPCGFHDCLQATQWLMENYQQVKVEEKYFVAGDSAGGNYAANVALALRGELCAQILIYPGLDFSRSLPSQKKYGQGYLLSDEKIDYYFEHYLKDIDAASPLVSPIFVDDVNNVSPAFIATAECDPLHDEGEVYAHKLQAANISCTHIDYKDTLHAFILLYKLFEKQNKCFYKDLADFVKLF